MEKDPLARQLIEHFACEETDLLAQTLNKALKTQRAKTLDTLDPLLAEAQGKLRMILLEILIKDGGADLIPFFIQCIRTEKNALYGKSQILLFKEFRHQRALGALLSIENEIDTELKSTFQRTLGRLLSQFSEQYYMSEFQAGVGDWRRVQFAADMMMRSPHPDFLAFLAERVLENDIGYRREGLRVLSAQGNRDSNDAIFAMLARLRRQTTQNQIFAKALAFSRENLPAFFQNLATEAGLSWSDEERHGYLRGFSQGEVEDALAQILDGYSLSGEVRKKIKPFLKGILCGGEPSPFQASRAHSTLEEYADDLNQLQKQSVTSMGEIATREDDSGFLERLEQFLPQDDSKRDALIIASLSGYRNQHSLELLTEYVNTCSEPELLEQSLAALQGYEVDEVPKGIEKLCFDESNGVLRRQAVDLMARWGNGPKIAEALIRCESLAVRADGVRIIAENRLEEGYSQLLRLLKDDIPPSLLTNVIEALASFPRATTARSLRPFLLPPHTASIRNAALLTCFFAGGEDRMNMIVRTLMQIPPGKADELLETFLTLVLSEEWEDREYFLLHERDYWIAQLTPEQQTLWPKILQLIESLPLQENIQSRSWLMGLKKVAASFTGSELGPDQRRVLSLISNLEQGVRLLGELEREAKMLHHLLESLKTTNPYQRTQAMRTLARNFPSAAVIRSPEAIQQIQDVILEEFNDKDVAKDTLIQAIALAGKLRHPKLYPSLRKLMEYANIDVRAAAKDAYELGLDIVYTPPVRRVFIMDDSRYITKQLTKVLTNEGYEVDCENDVEAGLQRLVARPFDLLIVDVIMPGKTGAEFLLEARRLSCAPQFTLVITSSRAKEELSPIMAVGVDGLLLKPFRMEDLINRLFELLPGSHHKIPAR